MHVGLLPQLFGHFRVSGIVDNFRQEGDDVFLYL